MYKNKLFILIFLIILILGCVEQFIPETNENQKLLVVEGLITDQPGTCSVKLSRSMKLGERIEINPVYGADVRITDDEGNTQLMWEYSSGTYQTAYGFTGIAGRKYVLHINTTDPGGGYRSYESLPMELIPVPEVDTLYYEKVVLKEADEYTRLQQGAKIYLDTYDETGTCRFFRWDFTETWEFRLPWPVENNTCWKSENAHTINIKSTSSLSESRINKHEISLVTTETDKLNVKYSILVNQYSVSDEEFSYWEKLKNVTQDVGSLYDLIPASIQGNVHCTEDPAEKVLGYFSVSAKTEKRIFIKDRFSGVPNFYTECIYDTIDCVGCTIWGLGSTLWILQEHRMPDYTVITNIRPCADCTTRGTTIKPSYWE